MILNIRIVDDRFTRKDMLEILGDQIHDGLKGNPNYVNSNVILNIDDSAECKVWIDARGCSGDVQCSIPVTQAIDRFMQASMDKSLEPEQEPPKPKPYAPY